MSDAKIKTRSGDVELCFDMWAWLEVEKKFGSIAAMEESMEKTPINIGLELAAIEANAACRQKGEKTCMTAEKLTDMLKLKQAGTAIKTAKLVMYQAFAVDDKDEEDDVDVDAEEEQKKTAKQ